MGRFNKVSASLSVGVLLFFSGKLVHTYGRTPSSKAVAGAAPARLAAVAPVIVSGGRLVPPPGTSSAADWIGADATGATITIDACNCFESVNYMTSGDKTLCIYRNWPMESITALDDDAAWSRLEHSLKYGDVVEFIASIRSPAGLVTLSNLHAQMCMGSEGTNGLMIGANNEPCFVLQKGFPAPTNRWATCTSHDYYKALRGMDAAWKVNGYDHTYQIRVYRRPSDG